MSENIANDLFTPGKKKRLSGDASKVLDSLLTSVSNYWQSF